MYSTNSKLLIHKKRQHLKVESTYQCVPCGKFFIDLCLLKHHNYQSHSERRKCEFCEKTFPTKFALRTHKVQAHNIKEGSFACDRCPKVFTHEANLQTHIKLKHKIESESDEN